MPIKISLRGQSMKNHRRTPLLFVVFYLHLIVLVLTLPLTAEAGKRRVHVPDDLDDVVDDEEDEYWKQWGKRSGSASPGSDPPPDFSKMDISQIQEEMMKRHVGPTFGFVKLQPSGRRNRDIVVATATRWNKVLKTGGIETTFSPIDRNTIMFTLLRGEDTMELREFLLEQQEAYEIKIGDRTFRRPGDPSIEEIMEKHHTAKKHKAKAKEKDIPDEEIDRESEAEL